MTKDVIIKIKGIQFGQGMDEDGTEVITTGTFFEKNGHCYVKYEEMAEGFTDTIRNLLKFDRESLEVTKSGVLNVHMVFEKGKTTRTSYRTPFGALLMDITTNKLQVERGEERINLEAQYGLALNGDYLADCHIQIEILSKDKKETRLLV